MKIIYWILIGIFIYGIIGNIYSINTFMDSPVNNYIESGKQILDKITGIVKKDVGEKTNYGKPFCFDNSDCNTIGECMDNLCICEDGECYG